MFSEMMSFALNEDVPAEYVPMMREQMGFCVVVGSPLDPPRRSHGLQPYRSSSWARARAGSRSERISSDLGIEYQIIERADIERWHLA